MSDCEPEYLCDQRFVLLHQLVQVFLILLQSLQQVHLLVLQQRQLLVHLKTFKVKL